MLDITKLATGAVCTCGFCFGVRRSFSGVLVNCFTSINDINLVVFLSAEIKMTLVSTLKSHFLCCCLDANKYEKNVCLLPNYSTTVELHYKWRLARWRASWVEICVCVIISGKILPQTLRSLSTTVLQWLALHPLD